MTLPLGANPLALKVILKPDEGPQSGETITVGWVFVEAYTYTCSIKIASEKANTMTKDAAAIVLAEGFFSFNIEYVINGIFIRTWFQGPYALLLSIEY
jgi:hypothetical protein